MPRAKAATSAREHESAGWYKVLLEWFRQRAWRYSPSLLLEKWESRSFDRHHGTDTSSFAELRSLLIDSPHRVEGERYQPSPVRSFRTLMRGLDIDYADYSFLDMGCGKGRTLMLASELPFRQVVGFDFSSELVDCANRNIACFDRSKSPHVAAVHCDATSCRLPEGNLVLYFFKPFTDTILVKVLSNVTEALRGASRRIVIVYLYLDNPALVEAAGFRLRRSWRNYRVYESSPVS